MGYSPSSSSFSLCVCVVHTHIYLLAHNLVQDLSNNILLNAIKGEKYIYIYIFYVLLAEISFFGNIFLCNFRGKISQILYRSLKVLFLQIVQLFLH